MLLLQQMIILFLLMTVGYICYKANVLDDKACKVLSAIVVNVANPAMVLTACMGENKLQGKDLLTIMALVIVVYVVLVLLAPIIPKVLHVEKKSQGAYKAMTVFSNIGFMGFPLVAALYGNEAVLIASLFVIPYNILIYTYAVQVMCADENADWRESLSFKKIFNVGTIATILTIIIYLLRIPVPGVIKSATEYLSHMTAPLSMMVIGASMVTMDLKKLFSDYKLMIYSLIKLIVIPIVGVLLIRLFIADELIRGVSIIMLATPVGSMTAMVAQQYDGDYEMASKGVALTTVLAVVTMPLVSLILSWI